MRVATGVHSCQVHEGAQALLGVAQACDELGIRKGRSDVLRPWGEGEHASNVELALLDYGCRDV